MGATASKPADSPAGGAGAVAAGNGAAQPKSSRVCSSWSNWSSDDDGKPSKAAAPSSVSVATNATETQTQMLIRAGDIPPNEALWYSVFEKLAGDAKSSLTIDATTAAVNAVPIGDEKTLRLPTIDESRATIVANVDGATAITAKLWVKLLLIISAGWSQHRLEISARAASKKITGFEALRAVEALYGNTDVKADVKDAKLPAAEKVGQQSSVREEETTTPAAASSASSTTYAAETVAPSSMVAAPASGVAPSPLSASTPSAEHPSLPSFSVAETATPLASGSAPTDATSPSISVNNGDDASVTSNEPEVSPMSPAPPATLEPVTTDDTTTTGGTADTASATLVADEEVKTPETPSSAAKKGKKGRGKEATPTASSVAPLVTQGSQKNVNAATTPKSGRVETPKGKAETPKAGAKTKGKKK